MPAPTTQSYLDLRLQELKRYESITRYIYLDSSGLLTVGLGQLLVAKDGTLQKGAFQDVRAQLDAVTKTDDLSNIAPGKDGVQGIEDIQLDMLTASLLANDKVLGSNKNLSITAVGGAQSAVNDNNWRVAA